MLSEVKNMFNYDCFPLQKITMNCNIHGLGVEALMNGNCAQCRENEKKIIREEKLLKSKQDALIPKRFLHSTLENYIPENEQAKSLLRFCNNYDFKTNLLFLGKTGTGKTHLGCSLISKAIKLSKSAIYIKFYQLTDIKIKNPSLFGRLLTCDILVIDEYGQQDSDFKSNLLFEIIDQRYDNLIQTIMISNLTAEEFITSISDPFYSRLKENTVIQICEWKDYRLTKNNN